MTDAAKKVSDILKKFRTFCRVTEKHHKNHTLGSTICCVYTETCIETCRTKHCLSLLIKPDPRIQDQPLFAERSRRGLRGISRGRVRSWLIVCACSGTGTVGRMPRVSSLSVGLLCDVSPGFENFRKLWPLINFAFFLGGILIIIRFQMFKTKRTKTKEKQRFRFFRKKDQSRENHSWYQNRELEKASASASVVCLLLLFLLHFCGK